ncbi:MAG: guanylate kinase [Lachnospiraceae bacterium]|nr:guanylate kinase [Lachnospiraceae bacterium]
MKHKGLLIVISGFSGAGKGTLMKKLIENYDQYALSISMTTRMPREGEVDGREYFFSTREQFEDKIKQGGLIEYAQYCGNYYGTPKDYVEKQLEEGKDVILEIEIQGAMKVKEKFPDTVLLFVMPPSVEVLQQRLVGRGTEKEEIILERLQRAEEEAEGIEEYDYIIVNDDLEACVKELHELLDKTHESMQEQYHPKNYTELIENIRAELKSLVKGEK